MQPNAADTKNDVKKWLIGKTSGWCIYNHKSPDSKSPNKMSAIRIKQPTTAPAIEAGSTAIQRNEFFMTLFFSAMIKYFW